MPLAQQHCAGGVTVSGSDNPTATCESFSLFASKQDGRRKAAGRKRKTNSSRNGAQRSDGRPEAKGGRHTCNNSAICDDHDNLRYLRTPHSHSTPGHVLTASMIFSG
ncbi:MAG: hypothetical protein FWD31_04990, partial [Planctomycetaceae bacterium]|nr:hypothetical protein [Planctomycetaceae bacterium]